LNTGANHGKDPFKNSNAQKTTINTQGSVFHTQQHEKKVNNNNA
jgi:hypothetical protein